MYQDIKLLSEYIIMYCVVHLKIWTQRITLTVNYVLVIIILFSTCRY